MRVDDGVLKKVLHFIDRYPRLFCYLFYHNGVCISSGENIKTARVISAFAAHIQIAKQVRFINGNIDISYSCIFIVN